MKILAVDTCSDILAVILVEDGKILAYETCNSLCKHSEFCLPLIETVLQENEIQLEDIDLFGVVVGAGSFTGIRIGVATMKAFCHTLNKKAICVTLSEILAYNCDSNKIITLTDAKQNKFYIQEFVDKKACGEIGQIAKSELEELLKNKCDCSVVSNIAIGDFESKIKFVSDTREGFKNCLIANCHLAVDSYHIEPQYVRKAQAEEDNAKKL